MTNSEARSDMEAPWNRHPCLYLLALERTGWRRWVFGRWVYRSEPFRRDIQRRIAADRMPHVQRPGTQFFDPRDAQQEQTNDR